VSPRSLGSQHCSGRRWRNNSECRGADRAVKLAAWQRGERKRGRERNRERETDRERERERIGVFFSFIV